MVSGRTIGTVATLLMVTMVFFAAGIVFKIPQLTHVVTRTMFEPSSIIYQTVERNVTVEVPVGMVPALKITVYGLGVFENFTSGEMVPINVSMQLSTGRNWIDSSNVVLGPDFQASIKKVRDCAQKVTNRSLQNYDIYVTLNSSAAQVEGTSGSSAVCAGVIGLLQNKSAVNDTIISGVIESDCSITEVEALNTKAEIALKAGIKQFLVPASECSQMNKSLGIQIVCVKDMYEAMPYLLK
jgi:predicted ATP-dependent protease